MAFRLDLFETYQDIAYHTMDWYDCHDMVSWHDCHDNGASSLICIEEKEQMLANALFMYGLFVVNWNYGVSNYLIFQN